LPLLNQIWINQQRKRQKLLNHFCSL